MKLAHRLIARLREAILVKQDASVWRELILRGALIGMGLLLVLTENRYRNLYFNLVALVVAMTWSYYDGRLSRGHRSRAWLEGLLIYLVAIASSNLLVITLGRQADLG